MGQDRSKMQELHFWIPGIWQHEGGFSLSVLDHAAVVGLEEEEGAGMWGEEGGGRLEEPLGEESSLHQEDQDCRRS